MENDSASGKTIAPVPRVLPEIRVPARICQAIFAFYS